MPVTGRPAGWRDSIGRIEALPTWVTRGAGRAGFAELADALLQARAAPAR